MFLGDTRQRSLAMCRYINKYIYKMSGDLQNIKLLTETIYLGRSVWKSK